MEKLNFEKTKVLKFKMKKRIHIIKIYIFPNKYINTDFLISLFIYIIYKNKEKNN